jgi:hypothetical protein
MAVVAGLIRARRNKTGPALPAARALPARVVADLLCAEARNATTSTSQRSSMRPVLPRRPNPASSKAAAPPPALSLPASDICDHEVAASGRDRLPHRAVGPRRCVGLIVISVRHDYLCCRRGRGEAV